MIQKLVNKPPSIDFSLLLKLYGEDGVICPEKLGELETKFSNQKIFQDFKCLVDLREILVSSDITFSIEKLFLGQKVTEISHYPTQDHVFKLSQKVAKLIWRLFDILSQNRHPFRKEAMRVHSQVFKSSLKTSELRNQVTLLTDRILHEEGFSYFVVSCLENFSISWTHEYLNSFLPQKGAELKEDEKTLYWLVEVLEFAERLKQNPLNEKELIKNIYPVIFLTPERGGLLEVDGPFFQEFEMIQEMVKEGLDYREELISSLFEVWGRFENWFDKPFLNFFEEFFPVKNKIYGYREVLQKVWEREKVDFSKDYLWVIEGNLSFVRKDYLLAQYFYEKALKQNPQLLVARVNLLFVLAHLKNRAALVKEVEFIESLYTPAPSQILFSIGTSYLVLGDFPTANKYFEELRQLSVQNLELQISIFCLDHDLTALALEFARQAAKDTSDVSAAYHLSRCYEKTGEQEKALEAIDALPLTQDSMLFYRFRLQRDLGFFTDAENSLRNLNRVSLDEKEIEEAIRFAKERNNLSLLRQFKK